MIWIQLIILLTAILLGSRMKGIGLGLMGMAGLLLFILFFHMRPTEPPIDVMLIILSIVTTAATLQAAGGVDYLVGIAEKIIRKHPSQIIFIGPLVVFCLALFAGTSHIVYSMLPIISEVSAKKRIRPERPLSISVVASHLALTGSPMSAATAALATILAYPGAAVDIMMIGIPSCLIGVLAGAVSVLRMGKDLEKDPVFIERMKDPAFAGSIDAGQTGKSPAIRPGAKTAVLIFGLTILFIVLAGSFPSMVPRVGAGIANLSVRADGTLTTATIIEILTLTGAALMMAFSRTSPAEVVKASLFTSMASAVVAVFGVVWMSSTFISHNQALIEHTMGDIAKLHPWTFSIAIFLMGVFMFSQAATTKTMMPLGLVLGISHPGLIAMFPTVNSDFVLPGYPTLLAAINFDRTGTTRIGRFIVNHSFIRPGLVAVTVAVVVGFVLTKILL
ncbi:MAG TPA: anaerobic C4-dicarboxylate transporter family protein [Puia sp.]|nr:anaerobic C4-dicarboxylate transporter family protein [Puia sp.]